jgi:hypothetical protein
MARSMRRRWLVLRLAMLRAWVRFLEWLKDRLGG